MTLADSYRYSRRITREHAKSFYFCSRVLPRRRSQAAYAVYAFCRHCDDVIDEAPSPEARHAAADSLLHDLDLVLAGKTDGDRLPMALALEETVKDFAIPRQPFEDLIHGVKLDADPVELQTWPELKDYCYFVASVVGLIMARVFGVRDDSALEAASDLGLAMQLTNICRDVGEDLDQGRVYLPAEELAQFGLTKDDLRQKIVTPKFRDLMIFQIARAREIYARSEWGIAYLADRSSRYTVWLMRHIYAGILPEIERLDYDVLNHRAHTSTLTKLKLSARAFRDLRHAKRG